jgi:hypothetical protein
MSVKSEREWESQMRRDHLAIIKAKLDGGERLTRDDQVALLSEEASAIDSRIAEAMKDRPDRAAFRHALSCLISEMMGISLVHSERRIALEERVAKLEQQIADTAPVLRLVGEK